MNREAAAASIRDAHERFRSRVAPVAWRERNTIAAATRQLAFEVAPLDVTKSLALSELAELLDVPRPRCEPPPPSTREPESRYAQPPDKEGDEYLRARSPRAIRRPPTEGD